MIKPSLFERLEGYAQENFTTEMLAFILETDGRVMSGFLDLLLAQQPQARRSFNICEIDTQIGYDLGRPDLEIRSTKDGTKKIHVEVKTQSKEGDGQIGKYLKLNSYVAYLTPLGFDAPSAHGKTNRYLGHFFWHDVHSIIKRNLPTSINNVLHRQFLQYLEARHMGPSKPLTRDVLKAAPHAVGFIRKSQEILDRVRKKVEREWITAYGKSTGGSKVDDGLGAEDLPSWWYQARGWWKPKRGFYLCIGMDCEKGHPLFYVGIFSHQKAFARSQESDLNDHFQRLKRCKWEKYPDTHDYDWGYRKYFPLETGDIDEIADRLVARTREATADLRRLRIITLLKNRI